MTSQFRCGVCDVMVPNIQYSAHTTSGPHRQRERDLDSSASYPRSCKICDVCVFSPSNWHQHVDSQRHRRNILGPPPPAAKRPAAVAVESVEGEPPSKRPRYGPDSTSLSLSIASHLALTLVEIYRGPIIQKT